MVLYYVTVILTSWLMTSARASFSPGCSFSDGQCQYNVQLGHQGQCDSMASGTVTSGINSEVCCDNLQGQISILTDDVNTLKTKVSTLMSELTSSRNNVSSMSSELAHAQDVRQQLLQTLAQKEAELSNTQSELSKVMAQAGDEIRRLTAELNSCKGTLGIYTNTTTTTVSTGSSSLGLGVNVTFCDFEDIPNFKGSDCGMTSDPGHLAFGFILGSGRPSSSSGPLEDHTMGSPHGHYMIMDTNLIAHNRTHSSTERVSLATQEFPPGPGYCLRLWYNMYGSDAKDFDIYVEIASQTGYPVFSHHGTNHDNQWLLAEADLDSEYTSRPFKIVISATTNAYNSGYHGSLYHSNGDVAVDDVYVYNTRCSNVPQCPSNSVTWTHGGQTYCYTFHTVPTTWYQAASLCRQEGATSSLVTIMSQEEQDFLTRTIKADTLLSMAGQAGFYTAGNDERSEHSFVWTDTGTPYRGSYTNWKAGQPNNVAGDQDCLLMQYPELDYQWGDVDCDELHPFICKSTAAQHSPSSSTIIG